MHDMKWIRENAEAFDAGLARRGMAPYAHRLIKLDTERRAVMTSQQELRARQKTVSQQIGKVKREQGDAGALMEQVGAIKAEFSAHEAREHALNEQLTTELMSLPNLVQDDVPDGADESANIEVRRWGTPKSFGFTPKGHDALGTDLGMMDFELSARLSGARFVVLRGPLARLERALGQFMLDLQTGEHGYTETQTPVLVRGETLLGTGQLPKFGDDLFRTEEGRWLIPTAEVTLTNTVAGRILNERDLPIRLTAQTLCFRAEAGAAGRDVHGMIRQHQFTKVELVSIVAPEQSAAELERKTRCGEEVLKRLGLPFRTVVLCTGDIGFGARKTYDIEVWLPEQGRYREISSCSDCGAFQARRMKARYRAEGEKDTRFVHTLNGSGLAVGRCLIAVMENYQNADGSVTVPDVLRAYMGGIDRIAAA